MKLIHYTEKLLPPIVEIEQHPLQHKPRGFWVSDDSEPPTWRDYVEGTGRKSWISAMFSFEHAYEVRLARFHDVLILRSIPEIETFVGEMLGITFGTSPVDLADFVKPFPWTKVAERYDGLIITPWEKYTDSLVGLLTWYMIWDCSSGCIWNPASILSIKRIKTPRVRR